MTDRNTQPTTSKPWEHRKSSGSENDELAMRFVCSLDTDCRLYDADIRGSIAHATMLEHVSLITKQDLDAIRKGLDDIRSEIESAIQTHGSPRAWQGFKPELEDVHMCIEAALVERIGDPARKLHTARSRNDQVALDLALWIRDAANQLDAATTMLQIAFENLADRDGDAVMPGYTHLQRAQPVCFGAECMAWHDMLESSRRWLNHIAQLHDGCPLGSGALAGTALPIDRNLAAQLLGFSRPSDNSIASTASRDTAIDLAFACARIATQLSRWAEQWIIWCTAEFAYLRLAEPHTTGSSMMPQKRNPDMLELIRGKAGRVTGSLVALLGMCKGLTIGYNRDLQDDKAELFSAVDLTADVIAMATSIVRGAAIQPARIASAAGGLDRGYLDATGLAEYLVTRGVPFRTAHQIVGSIVLRCEDSARDTITAITADELREELRSRSLDDSAIINNDDEFRSWIGVENVAARYTSFGSAGKTGFRAHLARARAERSK